MLQFSPFPHVVSLEHFSLTTVFTYVCLLFVMTLVSLLYKSATQAT